VTTSSLELGFLKDQERTDARIADELLGTLIQPAQYVGEVFALGYETALVQIHDRFRQDVGGVPGLCFLVATRLVPGETIDFTREDSSVILLRVMDEAPLPNAQDALRARADAAQRVSGEGDTHWDDSSVMDSSTAHLLSFAGLSCRVIGTFYLDRPPHDRPDLASRKLLLRFGSDISNFYPNRGLKVFKPNGSALRQIVNYRDLLRVDADAAPVVIGAVRYASTNRSFQGVSDVPVEVVPEDLLGQKTALFGMTRVGKSNTTKVVAKAVFELRFKNPKRQRIGQVIFDPNGEYANENTQDASGTDLNPAAIKNVWRAYSGGTKDDVITFGTRRHKHDPDRRLMLVNFFELATLQIGKGIIDDSLTDVNTQYVQAFRQATLIPPEDFEANAVGSEATRFARHALVYRALLAAAGYAAPKSHAQGDAARLFSADLINAMKDPTGNDQSDRKNQYAAAANTLGRGKASWGALATAFESLSFFISDKKSGYRVFNDGYMKRPGGSGDPWADTNLIRLLGAFAYPGGIKLIGRCSPNHTPDTSGDYSEAIYDALVAGKLVIVDQSGGEEAVNRTSATRVMEHIFRKNREVFRNGAQPPDLLVYVEEAHNILPSGSETDTDNIWVRTAKEGAKYHIGIVYATQEVSGVQKNILKNTSNWLIGHLNSTDETKELVKYYDFGDFEQSILRAQDRGFLRVKTLSNLFVVPVQVIRFSVGG
jgi:DNA helicase HerA-like ATPase